MDTVIATTKCYDCGGEMEGRKSDYKYVESGLDSVVLKDVLVFHCTKCNAIVAEIPAAGILHQVIALRLLRKKSLLSGGELRYLRKFCGYSVSEFAEIMGSSKSVISRWENSTLGKGTDRAVRLLVMLKLVREISGQPSPLLKNVTVEQLMTEMESAFKHIHGGREAEEYEISPEELAGFGGGCAETPELVGAQIN